LHWEGGKAAGEFLSNRKREETPVPQSRGNRRHSLFKRKRPELKKRIYISREKNVNFQKSKGKKLTEEHLLIWGKKRKVFPRIRNNAKKTG